MSSVGPSSGGPVRIGVAGCGDIARVVHLPLLGRRSDVEIRAIADPAEAARAGASRLAPSARLLESVEDLWASDLDAVVVALPTGLHEPVTIAALRAGLDVYVEKPVAADLPGSGAVLEAWRGSGRIGMVGYQMRFNPLVLRLRDRLRAGRIGRPVVMRSVFGLAPRTHPAWKQRRETGGGALLDLASHHIDLARFLFETEPLTARAALESRVSDHDTVSLELEMDGGPRVQGFYSLAASEHDRLEVLGDEGRLDVSRYSSLDVTLTLNPGRESALARAARRIGRITRLGQAVRTRRAPYRDPGYAVALDRFIEAVRTRRLADDAADLADGHACMRVIDAAERSARSGRPEAITTAAPSTPAAPDTRS